MEITKTGFKPLIMKIVKMFIAIAIAYLTFVFVSLEPDFRLWAEHTRMFFVFVNLFPAIGIFIARIM